jgi:hypothetical protein
MTGEPREDMDMHPTDRLPPIVTTHLPGSSADPALAGAPLPPYRPGLYAGLLADAQPHGEQGSDSVEAPSNEVGPPVEDGFPDAWRSDPEIASASWRYEEPATDEPEPSELLLLEDTVVEPTEGEAAPADHEPAPEDLPPWSTPLASAADESPWSSWDADEAVVYDLPGAATEDTGPWQDSWDKPSDLAEPETAEGAAAWSEEQAAEPEPQVEPAGEGPVAASVEEVDSGEETGELIEMVEEPGFGDTLEFAPADDQGDEAAADVAWASSEPAEPVQDDADAVWAPYEPAEPVEDDADAVWAPYEPAEPVADAAEAAWAPFDATEPAHEEDRPEETIGEAAATAEEPTDERVSIVPPTPLDSWFHGDHTAEAEANWEDFGRALEEAASWGDLGATIATGLTPEEARDEPEPAASDAAEASSAEPVSASAAEPESVSASAAEQALEVTADIAPPRGAPEGDPVAADLAGRLEELARRLREEGESGVQHAMAEGDRLEASLAGFIAGYFAARRG